VIDGRYLGIKAKGPQSEEFIEKHGGRIGDLSIYGQESNPAARLLYGLRDLGPRCHVQNSPSTLVHIKTYVSKHPQ
jgi:hypothetical protein